MITKKIIAAKAEEYNIPFANLLAGCVCENLISILSTEDQSSELWLCNAEDFDIKVYATSEKRNLYYQYCGDLDCKYQVLYLRDVLKMLTSKGLNCFDNIEGTVEDYGIRLAITVDEMYVPVVIYIRSHTTERISFDLSTIRMSLEEDMIVSCKSYPKEQIICDHITEIIDKLELINETERYYEVYEILSTYPINGRKVRETLGITYSDMDRSALLKRLNTIKGYKDYTYMKKKWKVVLRQKKTSEPEWSDVVICFYSFVNPIVESIIQNTIFLGDWMPQLKRFLD